MFMEDPTKGTRKDVERAMNSADLLVAVSYASLFLVEFAMLLQFGATDIFQRIV